MPSDDMNNTPVDPMAEMRRAAMAARDDRQGFGGEDGLPVDDESAGLMAKARAISSSADSTQGEKPVIASALKAASDAPNIIGVNPDTQRTIVQPERQKVSLRPPPPTTDKPATVSVQSAAELLDVIARTSDFRPMRLPSLGRLYADGPLHAENILVRPFRSGEEEILSTPQMFATGNAIEVLFQRCVKCEDGSPLKNPGDLLSVDRVALMLALRSLTYGSEYEFVINCGNGGCRKAFESVVNLDEDLEVYYLDDSMGIVEPMRTILPRSGLELVYRFGRGHDEMALYQLSQERAQKTGGRATDNTLHEKALMVTMSIGGITDKAVIAQALEKMAGDDLHHLRCCVESPPFYVDTQVTLMCPYCRTHNRMRLPFTAEFFLPPVETAWQKA